MQVRTETVRVDILGSVIGSAARADILVVLFGQGPRAWTASELGRVTRRPHQVVDRQLRRLAAGGLVRTTVVGGTRQYEADIAATPARELSRFVRQTRGRVPRIRNALGSLRSPVLAWAIHRPTPRATKGPGRAESDLLVLTSAPKSLARIQLADLTGAAMHVHPMSIREWVARLQKGDVFLRRARRARKLWILGRWEDLVARERAEIASKRALRAALSDRREELSDEWDEEWDPFDVPTAPIR